MRNFEGHLKIITFFLALLSIGLLISFALAQNGTIEPNWQDVASWFTAPAALGGVVLVVIAFIKANIYKLDGAATVIASLVLSLALSYLGVQLGHVDSYITASGLGFSAAVLASGGWDAIVGLLSRGKD